MRGYSFCSPVPSWKNHRRVQQHYFSNHFGDKQQNSNCLHHSTWTGDMSPFSEFATHVKVGKEEAPTTTVESAILRSMTALGSSSSRLSEDGKSYTNYNNNENSANPVLIVEDRIYETETDGSSNPIARQLKDHPPGRPMTPRQLLYLGCIWYLSADHHQKNEEHEQRSDLSVKPSRLSLSDATMTLHEGDYLRIHHTPRRFPRVYEVDWSFPNNACNTTTNNNNNNKNDALPVVVQQQGPGYCIIDKPPIIPVHATVDNAVENAAHQLFLALEQQQQQNSTSFNRDPKHDETNVTRAHFQQQQHCDQEDPPYLAAVQRLDVNTSGLMVMGTSPEFAAYFSQLLRRKTAAIDDHGSSSSGVITTRNATSSTSPTIEKGYKCLVCVQPDERSGESVLQAWKRLSNLQRPKPPSSSSPSINSNSNTTIIVRHYLQASDKAPKLFVDRIPDDEGSKWYECLMEITNVGEPFPLYATNEDDKTSSLANELWPKVGGSNNSRIPPTAKAVVEVQVSLLTGRTHQIRGQLSKLGFPIVGDEQYGGAIPLQGPSKVDHELDATAAAASIGAPHSEDPQLLALQCCHIGFRDAEYESVWNKKKRRYALRGRPSRSGQWVHGTLQNAWWTPFLKEQHAVNDGSQFSDIDFRDADDDASDKTTTTDFVDTSTIRASSIEQDIRPDMLPPEVQLSPGRNKYVVAKLRDPSTKKIRLFVQSAPLPYHAEVAFDLVEWIGAVPGYEQTRIDVTGGGRIDYNPSSSTVRVYGFSYRYGKGDHARVANLIETSAFGADLTVTFDLSDKLY
jgi:23S rRNA-/tRNA-specific pseudouridylate synthase